MLYNRFIKAGCGWVIFSVLFWCSVPATAQQAQSTVYREDTTIQLIINGQTSPIGFSGGYNNPQFAMADLDHDGKKDLVIFEKYTAAIKTYINRGTATNPVFTYAPHYAKNFPVVNSYLILEDYNCDGISDLFQLGNGVTDLGNTGFAAYKGYYNAKNELCFTFYRNLYYNNHPTANGYVNAYVSPTDIPAVVDIDGDGDLDFVSYSDYGYRLYWWKNERVENNLPCDSIRIKLRDMCWGKVDQGLYRTHTLGIYCGTEVAGSKSTKTTHGGNTPCLFDYDSDGDIDYLDGNVFFDDLVLLKNGKAQGAPRDSMIYQDTTWPSNGHIVNLPQWPSVYALDMDGDGVKELLISPHAENTSENYKCIWKYKRTGSGATTNYVFQTDSFIIDQTVDVGTAAYPLLYDYNKDGKPDLLVGSQGYYQTGGTFRSKLSYYQNTTVAGIGAFTLVTKDLLNVFNINMSGSAPSAGDINNDGLDDLVLGHQNGTLSFYKNNATSNSVQPVWQLSQLTMLDENNTTINLTEGAMPCIYDIDKDGMPDLLIGSISGKITYYRNVSTTAGQMKLHFVTNNLGNIQVGNFSGKSTPFIGKTDNSGKDYLLSGSDYGIITRYDGFQNGNTTIPYTVVDSFFSNIFAGLHTAITTGDIDGDGKYEMIVGNEYGGLNIYKQSQVTANIAGQQNTVRSLQLFPNPVQDELYMGTNGETIKGTAKISIINSLGQTVLTGEKLAQYPTAKINIAAIPAGIYLCVLSDGNASYSGRFIKK